MMILKRFMEKNRLSRMILYLTFCLAVFYPFKGFISLMLSLLVGQNCSWLINPLFFFFLFGFVVLNMIAHNIVLSSTADKLLLFAGVVGLAFGTAKGDYALLYKTFLLFFLPVLLGSLHRIDGRFFYRTVFMFIAASTIYMLLENIILHPGMYGLSFKALSYEQLSAYTNYLIWSRIDASLLLVDYRHVGLTNRTGGYLGNILAMPVLLAMGATFFYVSTRESFRVSGLVFTVISVHLLIMSQSTTAIVAFVITVLFYELWVRRNICSLIWLTGAMIALISFKVGGYVYERFLANMRDPQYVHAFLGYSVLLKPGNLLYLVFGKWSSMLPEGGGTHSDLINIVVSYGGVIAFLLYKRLLAPLVVLRRVPDPTGRIYALMVLTAFICLLHASATMNVNVMILVTLLYLKASARGRIFGCPKPDRLCIFRSNRPPIPEHSGHLFQSKSAT
ncbi:MAG: hypothetical protein ABH845_03335 [Candidatus Omnitrophota bacterium]